MKGPLLTFTIHCYKAALTARMSKVSKSFVTVFRQGPIYSYSTTQGCRSFCYPSPPKIPNSQRLSLRWQVLAYLKGRKQGVSRAEYQGAQLLPCSLIQKIWEAMREQEMVKAGDVKSLEKQIVEEMGWR